MIEPRFIEHLLKKIPNGNIFEDFANSFCSAVLGTNFMPHGGMKDKGIDGLEHIFKNEKLEMHIAQYSIEKNPPLKLRSTLEKLKTNGIQYEVIYYVTNQFFSDKESFISEAANTYKKAVYIYDVIWFKSNVNQNIGTQNACRYFSDTYLAEYDKPGKSYEISDLIKDPRLYVFLRQQLENKEDAEELRIDQKLAETLIIYALEGTDPDRGIFLTEDEIFKKIRTLVQFKPNLLKKTFKKRLGVLTKKPRKIQYHSKGKGYCLPYETRLVIRQKNVEDKVLQDKFYEALSEKFKHYLHENGVRVKDGIILIEKIIHKLFYEQGLEFADFVLKGEKHDVLEKNLWDYVANVVDESSVISKNKERIKNSLMMLIRELIYQSTSEEKLYLEKLSRTYMIMFLLQADPKLSQAFSSLASKLTIYVGNSIIIPALSEYFLNETNKRHWGLLKSAHAAGVHLVINNVIIKELANHFKHILRQYKSMFEDSEYFYTSDQDVLLIEPIMIRAYFYAKIRRQITTFYEFINKFVTIGQRTTDEQIQQDLIIFLRNEFGINFIEDQALKITIDPEEEQSLSKQLESMKNTASNAANDAHLILTVYALRTKNNERADQGIIGYRTWWLSKDIYTYRAVQKVFKGKYTISCYIRPDFLYNYISLAPKKEEVEEIFDRLFPGMLGVNISFHLPKDVVDYIHQIIKEHRDFRDSRMKAILNRLVDKMLSDPSYQTKEKISLYLDELLKESPEN